MAPATQGPAPGSACAAEAWYYAGYGYEAIGQFDQARLAFARLRALAAASPGGPVEIASRLIPTDA